ncbi:MAG: Ku protein [Clostridia bacterium]|nr:Ku protein [Clostridia bacterium]
MRSIWNGALSFGLVHIPVRLYAATEDRDVHFRQLHRADHTPIQYRRHCPACGQDVSAEEIVRGYEYLPGQFVVVDDEDLEKLPLPTSKTVEILDFVRVEEVDPIYFDRSYFLAPAEGGARPFALLRATMGRSGRAGLCRIALRAKERLGLVRLYGDDALVLETLHYPDEIRQPAGLEDLRQLPAPSERELAIAEQLVQSLSVPFQPERYHDRYREALRDLIERKVAGQEIVEPAPVEERVPRDLLAALEESVRRVEAQRALAGRTS